MARGNDDVVAAGRNAQNTTMLSSLSTTRKENDMDDLVDIVAGVLKAVREVAALVMAGAVVSTVLALLNLLGLA